MRSDEFELYDLRVEVVAPEGARLWCGARRGDYFELRGEMLHLPAGQGISIYSLASVLPLLAAKQRNTSAADWITTDTDIACPDPNCPSRLRITRLGPRRFQHADTTAVTMSATAPRTPDSMIARTTLPHGGHSISRLIKGGWHLAGDHGPIDPEQALRDMATFVDAGITTFDCADIYTNVETLIGQFRARYPDHAKRVRVHTKFVPNLSDLDTVDAQLVERTIDRSLQRLGMERLDLVQFHWWDFDRPGYVETALVLRELQRKGKIANLAVTNFDVAHLREITDAGVVLASHQLQYSVLDERPENGMLAFCQSQDIAFLCYGTVAGGFLSERWLGQPEPDRLTNRSLIKYKLIIDDFGGWERFQGLLRTLSRIAQRHGTDIASVATRVVLDRPNVAAAIVGATNASHLASHATIDALQLEQADRDEIAEATAAREGPLGDVYELERDRDGRHGRIMRYELQ
jgi:uncharacterized repeat protein (TIGR04076 family)